MECKVDTLIKEAISLMGLSERVFGMTSNIMYQLPLEPSRQEELKDLVMNFILNQEEKVRQLEEYMCNIRSDFMQLSLEVVGKLRDEVRIEQNRTKKTKKITRYPNTEDLKPFNDHKFSKTLTKEVPSHTPKIVSPKSLFVKHVYTIFSIPPLVREGTFGFKLGTNNNQNIKSRHDAENLSPQSSPQVLPSFGVYTSPVTYQDKVEEIIGIPIKVETLDETPLEGLGLNTCNHDIALSYREIPNFDELKPQPQPLPSCPSLDTSLGEERGPKSPIKPHSLDSFRIKVVDNFTINIPPSPHVASFYLKDVYCYYHPCVKDPKKHYRFKPGLLGHSGSLGVDILNFEMIKDDPPDTPYPPVGYDVSNILLRQRIDCCSLNNVSVLPNNTAYSANSIRCTDLQQIYTAYSNQLNTKLPYVNAQVLGGLRVATPRALVYAGLMTSGDARSWSVLIKVHGWFWRLKVCTIGNSGFKTEILDSKGAIPNKTAADAKVTIQEMAEYSQKWHNGTSSKPEDCPLKEEGKTLEEAYHTHFGTSYQPGGLYIAAGLGFYQRNNKNSSYPDRRQTLEESLTKFMAESVKRHEENSNIIKEIRASTDAAIRNQRASIKTLEI
nr:ribonuclease H-like domain-containing protein [Tanacetum cinerariifolium]